MFTREIKYDLVTLGCNVQWFKLMKTCVKIGSANDSRNLTRAIELFIFSDFTPENRFEYPVDFVSRHGDLQMFFTCMKLAGFDIDDKFNHPIVKNKIIPYAAQHQNWPIVTYLITKMDMEFRISLFENCMAQRDQKLSRFYKAATFTSYGIFGMQRTRIESKYYRKNSWSSFNPIPTRS